MSSVPTLAITYSFNANRGQATDLVDSAQLDEVLNQIADKLNEIILALDAVTDDDDTLRDGIIVPSTYHPEVSDDIAAKVNLAVEAALE